MSTELSTIEPSASEDALALQQIVSIEPKKYASLVFGSVTEKLAQYKTEADAVAFDVNTPAGMKTAIEWRAKFRDEIRLATESARKERKAPILEIGRLLDGRAKEITAEAAPYEERFDKAIKEYEKRREDEKQAKIAAEMQRVEALQTRLADIRAEVTHCAAESSEVIDNRIFHIESLKIGEDFQEFQQQAEDAKAATLARLRELHAGALAREAEQERIRLEREELARLREEAARREAAERARLAEEARVAQEQRELEAAQERERLRKERENEARIATIRQWITALNGPTHLTATDSPMLIEQAINTLLGAVVDERYGEFHTEAGEAREGGIQRLRALLKAAQAHRAELDRIQREREETERIAREAREAQEAEERRLAAERADLERQRSELAPPPIVTLPTAGANDSEAPDAAEIVAVLAAHYNALPDTVIEWLCDLDFSEVDVQEIAA